MELAAFLAIIGAETNFDEKAKADFLKGAKIAYESIITSFASGDLKKIKTLLDKKVLSDFNEDEKQEIEKITESIIESISILVDKKLELFSSTVNNK